jgi:hypothetical protein
MTFRRRGGPVMRSIAALGLALVLGLMTPFVTAQDQCTLCADGSDPDMSLMSADLGWSCTDLSQFASILKAGDTECTDLQIVGFQDCACPTYPTGFCSLCPGGFSDIPDKTVTVPSTTNLTCGDILFVAESVLQGGCEDLAPYRERCGCPTDVACNFCADGTTPANSDRILPYLTRNGQTTTCAQQTSNAFSAPAELCNEVVVAPVAVNAQGFCGCQGTFPSNLCTLCPGGAAATNPDLVVPQSGGLSCTQMEDYLSYITDEASCQLIADSSAVCCRPVESCPVCEGALYNQDKFYDPYGLPCADIGYAPEFGSPMTCDDIQTRFPYFCECEGADPQCTLCQLGELPPEMDKDIPLLGTTCKEVNDYASIRLTSECAEEKASWSFDASAYCGCTGFEPPDQCDFCPSGQIVRDTAKVPELAGTSACSELEDFTKYVTDASLCSTLQKFGLECCVDPNAPTEAPSPGPPLSPTVAPAPSATLQPTIPGETYAPTVTGATPPPSSGRTVATLVPNLLMLGVTMFLAQGSMP